MENAYVKTVSPEKTALYLLAPQNAATMENAQTDSVFVRKAGAASTAQSKFVPTIAHLMENAIRLQINANVNQAILERTAR